jgi:uncharacterized protein
MVFPVAGIEISAWVPLAAGFAVAFVCSMGGVSGANLLLPFQVSVLGFTTPAVSATNHLFNIVAIPSGVYRFIREGRMVWPLTWVVIAGTVPGVLVGVIMRVRYLPDPTHFRLFAGLVLLYIGLTMARSLLKKPAPGADKASAERRFQELVSNFRRKEASMQEPLPAVQMKRFSLSTIEYSFYGETFTPHTFGIFMLSAVVGVVGGMYGIGGRYVFSFLFCSCPSFPSSGEPLVKF